MWLHSLTNIYRNNPNFWDKHVWANSVDRDQTPQKAASDLGLHCLLFIQNIRQFVSLADKFDVFLVFKARLVRSIRLQYLG